MKIVFQLLELFPEWLSALVCQSGLMDVRNYYAAKLKADFDFQGVADSDVDLLVREICSDLKVEHLTLGMYSDIKHRMVQIHEAGKGDVLVDYARELFLSKQTNQNRLADAKGYCAIPLFKNICEKGGEDYSAHKIHMFSIATKLLGDVDIKKLLETIIGNAGTARNISLR